jgi:hypothetical protein
VPQDGFVDECTFTESVCCCAEPGGFGSCGWRTAESCRQRDGHATQYLNRFLACEGDPPERYTTCCCRLADAGATCEWESFDACSADGGLPTARWVTATDLCGPFEADDGCGCAVAGAQARPLRALAALLGL